jgi:hypothetical protein
MSKPTRALLQENALLERINFLQNDEALTSMWGTYKDDRWNELQGAFKHSQEAYTEALSGIYCEVELFSREALLNNEICALFASIPTNYPQLGGQQLPAIIRRAAFRVVCQKLSPNNENFPHGLSLEFSNLSGQLDQLGYLIHEITNLNFSAPIFNEVMFALLNFPGLF